MSTRNAGGRPGRDCAPCRRLIQCQSPGCLICPQGPPGPQGPSAATIPFSISQSGIELATDDQGNPQIISFSGFGMGDESEAVYLREGEWAAGRIIFRLDMGFPSAFVAPRPLVVRNIFALFSSKNGLDLEVGSIVRPFVCLATSTAPDLIYTILQDTVTYTEPYAGGILYPKHTLRRGSQTNLNIPISEGTLVGIVVGIKGENVATEQFASFAIAGGLYME